MSLSLQCDDCGDRFADDDADQIATCRICRRQFHLVCVDVTEALPNFGCSFCYELPGNQPRRRIRCPEKSAPVVDDGELSGGRHERKPNPDQSQRGTLVKSTRDEEMMKLVQNALENIIESKTSRSCTSGRTERIQEWVQEGHVRINTPRVPSSVQGSLSRRGSAGKLHENHQEDLALMVTRITSSDEFYECLLSAKQGIPGQPNGPMHGKKPPALPKFDGGDQEWLEFIAYYLETTREYKVSDLKNAKRLRESLHGQALQILNDTMIYTSSLPDALDQLRMTFGDPARIIAALEKEVLQTECVSLEGRNLQKLLIKTRRFMNYVEACGYNDLMTSRSLLSKLQDKLPFFMSLRWGDKLVSKKAMPSLKEFNNYLKEEFERALAAGKNEVRMCIEKSVKKVMTTVEVPNNEGGSVTSQPGPSNKPSESTALTCPKCKGQHQLDRCDAFRKDTAAERLKLVEEQKLCWTCLSSHYRRQCHVRARCEEDNCQYRHHRLLHKALADRFNEKEGVKDEICAITMGRGGVMFKILPVKLFCGERTVETFCFIDEGSSVSLIDSSLADQLGAKGPKQSLTIKWTNNQSKTDHGSRTIAIDIAGHNGKKFKLNNIRTMDDLELPEQTLPLDVVEKFFPNGDGPVTFNNAIPKLLLGLNHAHLGAPHQVREMDSSPLIAIDSRLGWFVYGGSDGGAGVEGLNIRVCHMKTNEDEELKLMMQSFFDLESFGVRCAPHQMNKEDFRAMEILKNTTRHDGERYESGLLWSENSPQLPESRDMCLKRMRGLRLRMHKDQNMAEQMQLQIDDYLAKGYCSDVTDTPPKEPVWYLPVFPVVNPNKPGKFRMVHDAAAKCSTGDSLNSFLLIGPDMLNPLQEVLMRFREGRVAISADVAEMFHQVRIREEDKDAQRFLFWLPSEQEPRELRMEVMMFGAACSPTTAQYVQRANAMLQGRLSRGRERDPQQLLC